MVRRTRRFVAIVLAGSALTCSTGCNGFLGLQDWQRDLLVTAANLAGGFLAGQLTRVVVERQCFANGVAVDCATIPGG